MDNRTPVKAKDTANRRSLNNTLTVLIRYALIGRNENDDSSSTSSSSPRRSDPSLPEPSDTLRVHSIIQEFFVDTLIECKEAAFWLERSVKLFCHSYDNTDLRIRQDPKLGLPEDYRQYSIHGRKLLDRLEQLGRKHRHLHQLRSDLKGRLESIRHGINELTKKTITETINDESDIDPLSIFQVPNSFSDSDSTKTSQGPMSHYDEMRELGVLEQDLPDIVESPTVYHPIDVHDTYRTPYPPADQFPMPKYPEDSGIGGGISTPQPQFSPGSTCEVPGDPYRHRTVKKLEERRYHDRAGSMRQTTGDHADARVNVNQKSAAGEISSPSVRSESQSEQSPDSSARAHLLRISNSLSWQKTSPPSGEKPLPLWSLLEKAFRKSPLASEAKLMPPQQDTPTTPPLVAVASKDSVRRERMLGPAAGAFPITRGSSRDSTTLQERLSRSDVVPGVAAHITRNDEHRRGTSVPPSREHGGAYIHDDDLSFPPDHPPTNPFSVDMPSWPTSLQPTGYTSQPMSRQISDNPAGRGRGVTSGSLPSGYATPRPRQRRPSQVETEPSPRLALLESGSLQDWDERHSRGGHVASVTGSRRGRGRTVGEYTGRPLGIEESPLSGGILTRSGFVAFGTEGSGEGSSREASEGDATDGRDTSEDQPDVGLGIIGGVGGA